jgi:hypothetical protein
MILDFMYVQMHESYIMKVCMGSMQTTNGNLYSPYFVSFSHILYVDAIDYV